MVDLGVWFCEIIYDLMDEILFTLAYPTFIIVCSAVWYSLLRWSSTCWCEQMREHPRATGRWWFCCIICMGWFLVSLLGFSLGLRPMYLFVLGSTCFLCKLFIQFSFGALDCKELSFKLHKCAIMLSLCNASFNFVF